MKLSALIQGIPGLQVDGDAHVEITQVGHDSRAVVPGALYIALPGRYYNGTRYIPDALANGAAAVAVQGDHPVEGATVLRLDQPRPAMV